MFRLFLLTLLVAALIWVARRALRTPPRPMAPPAGPMGRAEALAVLGLSEGASRDDIIQAHRQLIHKLHPDRGGSAELAAQVNRAKDLLLGDATA